MMTGHDIMGFALVAFLITVIFIVISLSCAGHVMCQRNDCRFKTPFVTCRDVHVAKLHVREAAGVGYRLANAKSSMITGHAITGFTLVAFLITVIFICNLLSCAGHVMCQRNDCRCKTTLVT